MANAKEDSLMGQIRSTKVGQSVSRTRRIPIVSNDGDMTPTEALAKLRNQLNQAVGRARKADPGSYFRVESATGVTDDKMAILCTVAVTRMAENDNEGDADEDAI